MCVCVCVCLCVKLKWISVKLQNFIDYGKWFFWNFNITYLPIFLRLKLRIIFLTPLYLSIYLYIYIYIYISPIVRETCVQSQVTSCQRFKIWYLIPPCLTLSDIRYVSRVKRSNPGKRLAPSPTPLCRNYWKGSLLRSPTLLYLYIYIYIYIYIYMYIYMHRYK